MQLSTFPSDIFTENLLKASYISDCHSPISFMMVLVSIFYVRRARPKMHSTVDLFNSLLLFLASRHIYFFFFVPSGPRMAISEEHNHMSRESDHLAFSAAKNHRG